MLSSPELAWVLRGESCRCQYTISTFAYTNHRYVLFSIGNLTPLFQAAWPSCWKTFETCNQTWVESVTYLEVCGIIVGQILVGLIGDG